VPELISLTSMRYRHRLLRPGVPFMVPTTAEAALLKLARKARDPEPEAPAPAPKPRAMEATAKALEAEPEGLDAEGDDKPARPTLKLKPPRYQRRDMRSDD